MPKLQIILCHAYVYIKYMHVYGSESSMVSGTCWGSSKVSLIEKWDTSFIKVMIEDEDEEQDG